MSKHHRCRALTYVPRVPEGSVSRARLPRLNSLAVVLGLLLHAGTSEAQTPPPTTLPTGDQGAYSNWQTGPTGAPGDGDESNPQAGSPAPTGTPDLNLLVLGNSFLSSGGSSPTLDLGLVGGTGGWGNMSAGGSALGDVGTPGGAGGQGGTPGLLQLVIQAGSSVTSTTTGAYAVGVQSRGGVGGFGGLYPNSNGTAGKAGDGGDGGTVTATLDGSIYSNGGTQGTTALLLSSTGGNGADCNIDPTNGNICDSHSTSGDATGQPGGTGGSGGTVNLTTSTASFVSEGTAVSALSQGGNGTKGSAAYASGGTGTGGDGGEGGGGGDVTVDMAGSSDAHTWEITAVGAPMAGQGNVINLPNSNSAQTSFESAAVEAQSFGGLGGAGGGVTYAVKAVGGAGGSAGSGGTVKLEVGEFVVSTKGHAAPALLAQSVGGSGGNGAGAGSVFSAKGGNGALGGNGGSVTAEAYSGPGASTTNLMEITTNGSDSSGIVAQSIGGGGGAGGDVTTGSALGGFAVGGNAEKGGDGGAVTAYNGDYIDSTISDDTLPGAVIKTSGNRSSGIVAMSVGGGGGSGGDASTSVVGPFSMTIGGNGGTGGDAITTSVPTQVTAMNAGIIQTSGAHAMGIQALAVGGGGGSGGSASSLEIGAQVDVTLAVGGTGGSGGLAGNVAAQNDGQILTQGSNAYGMQVMSVGGGGGNGGASKAAAYQLVNTEEAPSLDFNLTVGGNGGSGGNSGGATGTNNFSIVTNGAGSHGMLVQSIGGGGGAGGDSSSTQLNTTGSTVNINLAIGGQGGAGGSALSAAAYNSGIIWTMNRDADGIVAQSVGGGGGVGGAGNADTSQFQDNGGKSGQFNLVIGGNGGSGNEGGLAQVFNNAGGTIITMGDDSRGIFAQSVGGGGGKGAAAISNGSTGNISSQIAVGGNGGVGNDALSVLVTNNGSIITGGGDSAGIYAQSVGGGGGDGGNAGTGGNKSPQTQLFNYLAKSNPNLLGNYNGDTTGFSSIAGSLLSKGASTLANMLKGYYTQNAGSDLPLSGSGGGEFNLTIDMGGGFAGKGGAGGSGLMAGVTNTGTIQTLGPLSDGIFAESVGGGGGDGGSVTASDHGSASASKVTASIALGGRSGSSGAGALVAVNNNGSIATAGSGSMGILGASIGGGGGIASLTTTANLQNLDVQLGGNDYSNGNAYKVDIENASIANGPVPTITTAGNYAAGIGAVAIGGGGGVVTLNSTTTDATTGGAVTNVGGLTMDNFGMAGLFAGPVCGTTAATCGDGGEVDVTTQVVQTSGTNSHGVVAQSIGGGGGWVLGGAANVATYFDNEANGLSGNGGNVTVNDGQNISTAGAGAFGIIAQSVGGGGLLAGDFSSSSSALTSFTPEVHGIGSLGNGGAVSVYVNKGATLTTSGQFATGILAQSVGGGGGFVADENGTLYAGTAGGVGTAGPILVQVDGSVSTTGKQASAILVNADGTASTNSVNVNVTGSAFSADGATIDVVSNAPSNTVTNTGVIAHAANEANEANNVGFVVLAERNAVNVNNNAGGTLTGAISLGGGTLTNSGTWAPEMDTISKAGNINSTGTIVLGSDLVANATYNVFNTTTEASSLTSSGTLRSSVDFVNQNYSTLDQIGTASVSGTVMINPLTMAPGSAQIIYASSGLTLDPNIQVVDTSNYLYNYNYSTVANTLVVTPQLNAVPMAQSAGLSRNALQLANHLQANFNSGNTALWPLYTALANVHNAQQYHDVLQGLGTESLQMVGVARTNASELFVNRMNACPDTSEASMDQHQRDCVWGRVSDHATTGDGSDGDSYHLNEHVVQLGGQHEFADGWWAGGSVAYNKGSESAASGVGGVTDHGFSVGAVVKREWGPWLFTGALDFGLGSYQSNRNLQLTDGRMQASGSFDASNVGLHSRVAYLFSGSNWYVKPYVDLHAVNIHTDSFKETNLGAIGYKVGAGNGTVLSATPMVEVGSRFTFDDGVELRPSVAVGEAIYSGNHWDTNLQLIGSGDGIAPFNSKFTAPNHMNQYNAGLDLKINSHSDLRLDYTGQFGNGYRSSEGALRYSYFF